MDLNSDQKLINQFEEHRKNGKDWEKMEIPNLEGVFIVKIPPTKTRDAQLNLAINPIKDEKPIKRKDLYLKSYEEIVAFGELLLNDTVVKIIRLIEGLNNNIEIKIVKKLKM